MVIKAVNKPGQKGFAALNHQSVGLLCDGGTKGSQPLGHSGQAVAFFDAQTRGPRNGGFALCQCSGGCKDGNEVRDLRGVDVDAAERCALYGKGVALPCDLRAKAFK